MANGWCYITHMFLNTYIIDYTIIYLFYSSKVGNDIEIQGRFLDEIFAIQGKPKDTAMGIRLLQLIYVQNWGSKVPRNEIVEYAESSDTSIEWHTLFMKIIIFFFKCLT
jgi:hypothetical protein